MARFRSSRALLLLLVLVACLSALPLVTHAQTAQDELHAAIMNSLLADPRTANIPPEQLRVLVDALALQAQAQSVTAADILWHPDTFQQASGADQSSAEYFTGCAGGLSALCPFSAAFGFAGSSFDPTIPLGLFASSGLLFIILRRMIKLHETPAAPPPMF